jgi:signal transduction histidine kinase
MGGLRPVIDRLPEAILITDQTGVVRLTNGAADRMFAGDPVRTDADLASRLDEAVLVDGPVEQPVKPPAERTVRLRHQPNAWYELDRVPLGPDPQAGAAFVLRDVTFSRDLEAEREAFLSVISHELRTPLTTIYAGSSVLARRQHLSHPATRTLAMDISLEAARLYDIVENLLLIARLERRVLDPIDEPVDLRQVVKAAVRQTTDRFRTVKVARQVPRYVPLVRGDATYVEQAVRNLILAFIRGSGFAPDLRLVARIDVDEPGKVAVRVMDDAGLLSDDELTRAFELPNPSSTGRLAVIGMELYVVRHAVEAMGGRAWAENRPDGGLELGFALQTSESRADEADSEDDDDPGLTGDPTAAA